MNPAALQRHLGLPVGVHRETREPLTLAEAVSEPAALARRDEMTMGERTAVVRRRWEAGEWSDMVYGTDGVIDLPRAVRELESGSDMGQHLLRIGERAMEMALEDARGEASE